MKNGKFEELFFKQKYKLRRYVKCCIDTNKDFYEFGTMPKEYIYIRKFYKHVATINVKI